MKTVLTFNLILLLSTGATAQYSVGFTSLRLASLHVADSSVLYSSPGNIPSTPGSLRFWGTGRRMLWYADKAAFRAGYINGSQWDADSIGSYSFATGINTQSSGMYSFAAGSVTVARGDNAVAIGSFSNAYADGSMAIGHYSNAYAPYSLALGFSTTTYGKYSTALGEAAWANARSSFTIGAYNDVTDNPDVNSAAPTDRLFQIGNGGSFRSRSNALTVLRNGNMGIGTVSPQYLVDVNGRMRLRSNGSSAGILYNSADNAETVFAGMSNNTQWGINGHSMQFLFDVSNGEAYKSSGSTAWVVASDARLKQNIRPYTDGLHALMQIEPVWFTYKNNSGYNSSKPYVGVLAQQLQQSAPYMVGNFTKDGKEFLNVDNSAMTYMLINAVKEQQQEIEALKKKIERLEGKN